MASSEQGQGSTLASGPQTHGPLPSQIVPACFVTELPPLVLRGNELRTEQAEHRTTLACYALQVRCFLPARVVVIPRVRIGSVIQDAAQRTLLAEDLLPLPVNNLPTYMAMLVRLDGLIDLFGRSGDEHLLATEDAETILRHLLDLKPVSIETEPGSKGGQSMPMSSAPRCLSWLRSSRPRVPFLLRQRRARSPGYAHRPSPSSCAACSSHVA